MNQNKNQKKEYFSKCYKSQFTQIKITFIWREQVKQNYESTKKKKKKIIIFRNHFLFIYEVLLTR